MCRPRLRSRFYSNPMSSLNSLTRSEELKASLTIDVLNSAPRWQTSRMRIALDNEQVVNGASSIST